MPAPTVLRGIVDDPDSQVEVVGHQRPGENRQSVARDHVAQQADERRSLGFRNAVNGTFSAPFESNPKPGERWKPRAPSGTVVASVHTVHRERRVA